MHERAYVLAASISLIVMVSACGSRTESPATNSGAGSATMGGALVASGGSSGAAGSASLSGGSAQGGTLTTGGGGVSVGGSGGAIYVDFIRTGSPDACYPRVLPFGAADTPEAGRAQCSVGEIFFTSCDCTKPGLAPLSDRLLSAAKAKAKQSGVCDGSELPGCEKACGCEIVQPAGTSSDQQSALYACENDVTPPPELAGFCFIDATGPTLVGNQDLVSSCPSRDRRRLRFIGPGLPDTTATTFITCASTPIGG